MEPLIDQILQTDKKDLENLKKSLEKHFETIKTSAQLNQAFSVILPEKHTLAYAYFLSAKCFQKLTPQFVQTIEQFLFSFNADQAKLAAQKFVHVVHVYCEFAVKNQKEAQALYLLENAIPKFALPNHLTPLHSEYLCMCLKQKNFKSGLELLQRYPIFEIDPEKTGLTPKDYLLYFYYGGMIYVGVKKFDLALQFFEMCLEIPMSALSAIVVEAFKKFCLVSLLGTPHGKFNGFPKHCVGIIQKSLKTICKSYADFAQAFSDRDTDKIQKIAKACEKEFKEDNNNGLVQQCVQALFRRNISSLTAMYVTLSLNDIASFAKLQNAEEAENLLLRMIENGEISAKIDQSKQMVEFKEQEENTLQFDSSKVTSVLLTQLEKALKTGKRLHEMNRDISSSQKFIAKLHGVRDDEGPFSGTATGTGGMFFAGEGVGPRDDYGSVFDTFYA